MNQSFDRKWLVAAMKTAFTVVNKRSPKPILQKLLLTAGEGIAGVHGTDTELSVSVFTETENSTPSKALLPLQALQFFDSSDSVEATITLEDSGVKLKCDRSVLTLHTEDPMEFPVTHIEPPDDVTKVDGKLFQRGIRRTMYALDEDSTRFALGAVLLQDSAEGLITVGTDGRRLSTDTVETIAVGGLSSAGILLPARAAKALCTMQLEEPWLWVDRSNICLADAKIRLSARMVEGRYPNWTQVLPNKEGYQVAKAAREPLLRLIKQASIVANAETRGVVFTFDDGTLSAAASAEVGQSKVQMPIEYSGDKLSIQVDHGFLSDYVEQADEVLDIYIKNDRSPLRLESGEYVGVVMPMALEA